MELTIKDRVLLLNEVMPQFDSMAGILTKKAITEKLKLSEEESGNIVSNRLPNGFMDIGFKNVECVTQKKDIELTDEELFYIKKRIHAVDVNGMISEDNIDSYQKILDAKFHTDDYQRKWDDIVSPK